MKTRLDCIPCFFRQLLEGARVAGARPEIQKKVMDEFALILPGIPLDVPPPVVARAGYRILSKLGLNDDPYKALKKKSNRCALGLFGKLKDKVFHSGDALLAAVELAIAGNIIDFGVKNNLNIERELENILLLGGERVDGRPIFFLFMVKCPAVADETGREMGDMVLLDSAKTGKPSRRAVRPGKVAPGRG